MSKDRYKDLFIENEEADFESVCNYGIFPVNYPMNVDDYKFEFKNKFLDKLSKLYDKIREDGDKFIIEDSHKISPKLFLRDILTEYMVKNIFDNKTQNNLIHIINKIMTSMYDQFYKETKIRLYFVYRGGNIIKLYKNTFENILPGIAKKIFKEEFDEFFKNSDIDFYTIIGGAKDLTEDEIFVINSYIQMMCYYGLYVARIFIMNNFDLFEFCKFNRLTMKEDFQQLLNKMNEDKKKSEHEEIQNADFIGLGFNKFMYTKEGYDFKKILNLPENKIFSEFIHNVDDISVYENYKKYKKSGRFDINISLVSSETTTIRVENSVESNNISYFQDNLFKEDFEKMIEALVKKNEIFDYYITNNNEIYNKEEYVDFSLVRLMINFTIVYKRGNRYGITNAPSELFDLSIGHPDDKVYYVYTEKGIVPYEFKYDDPKGTSEKKDTIYVPAIPTTIIDLIKILFGGYPWEDPKYRKRLYRLMILIFIQELSNSTIEEMEDKLKSNQEREYKDERDNDFETLRYRNRQLKKSLPKKYQKEYKEYKQLYKEINTKLLNVLKKLKTFRDKDQQILERDIYRFSA